MIRLALSGFLFACVLTFTAGPSLAQDEHEHMHAHGVPEKLGHVHFPISCRADLQPQFDRAMALLHSFAYAPAAAAFQEIAAQDPDCAMAQWGIAMTYFHQVWAPPTPGEFAAGKGAADKAASLAAHATPRERDYIAALHAYYESDSLSFSARVAIYKKAMAGVAERNPDDHEAQIFHALAILSVVYNSPPDKTHALQKRAAEMLNRLLPLEPEHPGIAHYIIHALDFPDLAELALPAARAYSKIAPSAPHALHMPSHIFTRLGMWQESVESNLASINAADQWIARSHPGATSFDALHAMDYLEYAYLQLGRDHDARALLDSIARVSSFDAPAFSAGFALAAIPARYALERKAWKDAAALDVRPSVFPWKDYPYAEANVHFAKAMGAARSGDVATAQQAIARLAALEASLQGQKGYDWATQVEIQRRAAAAWLARAEKRNDEALSLMRSTAALEDSTDKHNVTPGSILPAREQLADMLLELGKPAAALTEYQASLRNAPARFNSYLGAARAAEQSGQKEKAKDFRDRLAAMCGGSVPDRMAAASAK